ncbi:hypothetical protein KIH86_06090 [Paenibacillus sp. HN-1]|uniref:DUF1796 family putative cysteine peptidase n=1 Tax=Paenibacillus TaxID=44249 RepID=UPI001CA882C7|nr:MULTISPECIES: DUF1796 family putative cysteine peptidase [Paenibacillus]MBY9078065.1 hypothetical protein [Paenibacillus sp. CGMCC 1.18879]MBY9083806.1 hypothetical protein [Paenibacillus sinensis]
MDFEEIAGLSYTAIHSLGHNCLTATELRRSGLRMQAGPLDWMYAPDARGVIDLLLADFQDFFDKSNLEVTGINSVSQCYMVVDRKYHMVSMHDFGVGKNSSDDLREWEAVNHKLKLRSERMLAQMRTLPAMLFIRTDTTYEEAAELSSILEHKTAGSARLLIINHTSDIQTPADLHCQNSRICMMQIPQVPDMFEDNRPVWEQIMGRLRTIA